MTDGQLHQTANWISINNKKIGEKKINITNNYWIKISYYERANYFFSITTICENHIGNNINFYVNDVWCFRI